MTGSYSRGRQERRSSSSSSSESRYRTHSANKKGSSSTDKDPRKSSHSKERRDSPKRRHSPSPKRSRRSPPRRHSHSPRRRGHSPPPHRRSSPHHRSPPEKRISPHRGAHSSDRKGRSPPRRSSLPQRSSPPPRLSSPPRRTSHPSPPARRASPPRRSSPPARRASPPRRSSPPARRPSPPRRSSPPARRPSPPGRRSSPTKRAPSPGRRPSPPHRPTPSSQRPDHRSSPPRRASPNRRSPPHRMSPPARRKSSPVRARKSRSRSPVRDRRPVINEAESTTSQDPPWQESNIAQRITLMAHGQDPGRRKPSPETHRRRSPEHREPRERREPEHRRHSPPDRPRRASPDHRQPLDQPRHREHRRSPDNSRRQPQDHQSRRRSPEVPRKDRSRSPVHRSSSSQWQGGSSMAAAAWASQDSDLRYETKPSSRDQYHRADVSADRYGDKDDRRRSFQDKKDDLLPLSNRFAIYSKESTKPFVPKDNITVGIERNISGHSPVRRRDYVWEEVRILRRKDEGENPLCLREEFKGPPEDYKERRVIKVMQTESSTIPNLRISSGKMERENFEVRRDRSGERPSLSERWRSSDTSESLRLREDRDRVEVIRKDDSYSHYSKNEGRHGDHDERVVSDTRRESWRGETGDSGVQFRVRGFSPQGHGDRDERLVTQRSYRDEDLRDRHKDKLVRDPGDLRHNLSRRRRSDGDEIRVDIRRRLGDRRGDEDMRKKEESSKVDKKILPDFSRRPDRFVNEDWKDKPEMIPKGSSYFEHDNREDEPYWHSRGGRGFRSRGGRGFRGGFRGRFRGRGSFRGGRGSAPYIRSSRDSKDEGAWTHDKFTEMEDDADNKPSSTTETK